MKTAYRVGLGASVLLNAGAAGFHFVNGDIALAVPNFFMALVLSVFLVQS